MPCTITRAERRVLFRRERGIDRDRAKRRIESRAQQGPATRGRLVFGRTSHPHAAQVGETLAQAVEPREAATHDQRMHRPSRDLVHRVQIGLYEKDDALDHRHELRRGVTVADELRPERRAPMGAAEAGDGVDEQQRRSFLRQPRRQSRHCLLFRSVERRARPAPSRLLTSLAYDDGRARSYTLEGTVNGAGSALAWACASINTTEQEAETRLPAWLSQVRLPLLFINAVAGLGCPHWCALLWSFFFGVGVVVVL